MISSDFSNKDQNIDVLKDRKDHALHNLQSINTGGRNAEDNMANGVTQIQFNIQLSKTNQNWLRGNQALRNL